MLCTLGGCHEVAFHDTILSALSHAVAATPHGVYEAYAQKCARELLAALKAGDMDTSSTGWCGTDQG